MDQFRNVVQLVGNIGLDPEVKSFDSGKKMARFSVATQESYKKADGEYENKTYWHNIVAWGKLAELVEKKFRKGSGIAVMGKIVYHNYETTNGEKRNRTEINASQLTGIGFV